MNIRKPRRSRAADANLEAREPEPVAASELSPVAARIVEAVRSCSERESLAALTVEQVLQESGISRTTFYRHFSNLQAVLVKMAVLEGAALVESAVRRAAGRGGFVDQLVAAVVDAARHAFEGSWAKKLGEADVTVAVVRAVLESEPASLATIGKPLHRLFAQGKNTGELRANISFDDAAEWILRNVWSLQIVPGPSLQDEEGLRRYVRDFVVPGLLSHPGSTAGIQLSMLASLARIENHLGLGRP
jgi:AcrR family transcriptional regulator